MTEDRYTTGNEWRGMLAGCRQAIARFPLRKQAALLHEFEEAETRLTAIERANAEAQITLMEHSARELTEGPDKSSTPIELQQSLNKLQEIQTQLSRQLDVGNRRVHRPHNHERQMA